MIKKFRNKLTIFLTSLFSLVLFSCGTNSPDTSTIEVNVQFKDFTEDIMEIKGEITPNHLLKLREEYGAFYDDYIGQIMRYGSPLSDTALRALNYFKQDPHEQHLYKVVKLRFGDFTKQKKEILDGYKNYKYYFPEDTLRDVVTYISNFTMNINPVGEDYTGLSLEMYMGDTFTAYKVIKPELPTFLHKLFTPSQVPIQNLKAIINEKIRMNGGHKGRVLDEMVLWGKLFYICEKVLPNSSIYEILGYDEEEWQWNKDNESEIWRFFIKDKKMFENMNNANFKLFSEGPRTNYAGVPIDYCAPMLGKFTGYKLISSYMENNDLSLEELVSDTDSDKILKLSEYKP